EGGAGTYSDGKLTTRIHKGPVDSVFRTLVDFGAPDSILYDAKPHIGTDILSEVIASMRRALLDKGTEILFSEKVTGIISENGQAAGVVTSNGKEYRADSVIIATGHSARDTYKNLVLSGVSLEKKGFAAGFRIEHPAEFINRTQYGSYAGKLPAADYRLAYNNPETGRGVYSFCMCPGGEVINSSSEKGMLCVNGMSMSARNGIFSNAAIVVSLRADDFPGDILSGIEFQRDIEKKAFSCAGGEFRAPAQKASDFVKGISTGAKIETSFLPSVVSSELSSIFSPFMRKEFVRGLKYFDRLMPGFIENGVCIGVESRTSSPVRITRTERMESVSVKNLYPIGEGAGYAGGIVSSAVDGLKCADMIISGLSS
ncbi:MAG TPA: FAD-dependent oxidoreductase, partial [Spirochaetota bacterium]|nr:FAD-dependent oxidoreductase [Spirochaetota bacterium]